MTALGDLLELLHDAHARVGTVEIEYQDSGRPIPTNELAISHSDGGKPKAQWRGAGPWPATVVSTRRIWLEPPDRARVEVLRNDALIRLAVRDGPQWWRWDAEEGELSGSALPDAQGQVTMPSMLSLPLLDVRRLMATLWFEPTGVAKRAGRRVLCARARPRVQPAANGSISYELEFDAEHGSLLRRAEFEDGQRVWERLAIAVLYDARIDRACFTFAAPD